LAGQHVRHERGSWAEPTQSRFIYVPALMITHIAAFYLLLSSQPKAAIVGDVVGT
jgi:hypothetical protein